MASADAGDEVVTVALVERSMPVMAATRAVRRSCSARCPDTPAPRRSQDTTSATRVASTTPAAAASRTGTTPKARPQASAPAAITRYTPRMSQP